MNTKPRHNAHVLRYYLHRMFANIRAERERRTSGMSEMEIPNHYPSMPEPTWCVGEPTPDDLIPF